MNIIKPFSIIKSPRKDLDGLVPEDSKKDRKTRIQLLQRVRREIM